MPITKIRMHSSLRESLQARTTKEIWCSSSHISARLIDHNSYRLARDCQLENHTKNKHRTYRIKSRGGLRQVEMASKWMWLKEAASHLRSKHSWDRQIRDRVPMPTARSVELHRFRWMTRWVDHCIRSKLIRAESFHLKSIKEVFQELRIRLSSTWMQLRVTVRLQRTRTWRVVLVVLDRLVADFTWSIMDQAHNVSETRWRIWLKSLI